jgi:hypothetical protein
VDQQWRGPEARWSLADTWRAGAWGRWCSPAVAGEDERDEAELVRDSPKHERRLGRGTMETESGEGLSSVREWRRARENSGMRDKGVGCSPFYRGRGMPGRHQRVVTARVMGLTPLMVGEGLRAIKEEF